MSIVAKFNLKLQQLNINTTFLNGELKEVIFMNQLKGFQIEGYEDKVYKLKSSLYVIKQLSRK